jgi:hypothetical protein
MRRVLIATAAVFLIATPSVAQSFYIPSNSPSVGGCNVIPFGIGFGTSPTWANQKYQCMASAAQLGNKPVLRICDIAFAACGTGIKHFDTIEIKLAQTNASVLSTTFSANMVTNVQTVLSAKDYQWHRTANTWDRIGFDKSYTYIAGTTPNLVIQITVTGSKGLISGTRSGNHTENVKRIWASGWTGAPPAIGRTDGSRQGGLKFEVVAQMNDVQQFGLGCRGTAGIPTLSFPSGSSAKLGGSLAISVANCIATTPVLHVLGFTRFGPGIDLGIIGAPGCKLYETTDVIFPGVSNSSGVYSFQATVPNDTALICFRIYTQVFPSDPNANGWGRTASNYGRILPGN